MLNQFWRRPPACLRTTRERPERALLADRRRNDVRHRRARHRCWATQALVAGPRNECRSRPPAPSTEAVPASRTRCANDVSTTNCMHVLSFTERRIANLSNG